MKKTAAKSTAAKTPAPSTKAVEKKLAAIVKKATPPAPKPVAKTVTKTVAKPLAKSVAKPASKSVAEVLPKAAPVVVKASVKAAVTATTIVVAVDVGFGNVLTIRGEGAGLSWEVGLPLECSTDDRWTITLPETGHPIICKFLINDSTWCAGQDYTVLPGASIVLSPIF